MSLDRPDRRRPTGESRTETRLGWPLTVGTAFALLFFAFGLWVLWLNVTDPQVPDFAIFWAAGRLALGGNPASAYDLAALHGVDPGISLSNWLPFAYPPPFLLVLVAVAALQYSVAFTAWLIATAGLYLYAATRFVRWQFALLNPPLLINSMIGQSGFLTSGIFVAGLSLISRRPFAAGLVLGALVVKPQLALLLPVAMLAGREWRVIAGAIVSVTLLLGAALVAFGPGAFAGFFSAIPHYTDRLQASGWPWNELASPFALARFAGLAQTPALVLHAAIAAAATLITARAWWLRSDERIPILAAATLLIPPYVFTYDALLLIVPAAWLIRERRFATVAVLWFLVLSPLLTYFTLWVWPNLISLASLLCLWRLHRPQAVLTVRDVR